MREASFQHKTLVPRHSGLIYREPLLRELHSCNDRPITFVLAPAGFGKTALLVDYLNLHSADAVWYRLDHSDADPHQLASTVHAHWCSVPFGAKYSPTREELLPGCLDLLLQPPAEDRPKLLILDDYHHLRDTSALDAWLFAFMERWNSDAARILVASRTGPDRTWSQALLNKSYHCMTNLSTGFTGAEADAIVANYRDADPQIFSRAEVRGLIERTKAWPSCLILMLEYAKNYRDLPAMLLREQTQEILFTYLLQQVLAQFGETDQILLMRLALSPRVSPAIVEQLFDEEQRSRVWACIQQIPFLVHNLGEGQDASGTRRSEAFRFHDLLYDFLASEARKRLSESDLRETYRRLADILRAEGAAIDAIQLAQLGGDEDQLAGIIKDSMQYFLGSGWYDTIAAFHDVLVKELDITDPVMQIFHGMQVSLSDTRAAEAIYRQALKQLASVGDNAGVASVLHWLLALVLNRGEAYAHEYNELLDLSLNPDIVDRDKLPSEIRFSFDLMVYEGMAACTPGHPSYAQQEGRLLHHMRTAPNLEQRALALSAMFKYHILVSGDGRKLDQLEQISSQWSEAAVSSLSVIARYGLLEQRSYSALVREGSRQQACDYAGEAVALASANLNVCYAVVQRALTLQFWTSMLANDSAACEKVMEQIETLTFQSGYDAGDSFMYTFCRWSLARMRHDSFTMTRLAARLPDNDGAHGSARYIVWSYWLKAVTAFEHQSRAVAWQYLSRARSYARSCESRTLASLTRLTAGLFCLRSKRPRRAEVLLRQALETMSANKVGLILPLQNNDYLDIYTHMRATGAPAILLQAIESALPELAPGYYLQKGRWTHPIQINLIGTPAILHGQSKTPLREQLSQEHLLIATLARCGAPGLEKSRLRDILWPGRDVSGGALRNVIYRARRVMGSNEAIETVDQHVRLNPGLVYVDQSALEEMARTAAELGIDEILLALKAWVERAEGKPLPTDAQRHVRGILFTVEERLSMTGHWQKLLEAYQLADRLLSDPDFCCQGSMRCLAALQNHRGVEREFQRYKAAARQNNSSGLSDTTVRLYMRLSELGES